MKHRLADLLDIPALQSLLDSLYASSKIPSAIIDNEGKILTGSGWQDACTKFHRVHPDVEKLCVGSDRRLIDRIDEAQPAVVHTCPQGLTDSATPLIVQGAHVANVFTGQLFLAPPDIGFFRSQARRYGWDEEAYIEAIRKVPVISEEALLQNIFFIARFTEMLAETGLRRLREREALEKLHASEEWAQAILQTAIDGFWMVDGEGRLLEVNEAYCRMSGYDRGELLAMRISDLEARETPGETAERIRKVFTRGQDRFETVHRRKDGSTFDTGISVHHLPADGGRIVAFLRDISERKRAEEALKVHLAFREGIVECAAEGVCVCHDTSGYPYVKFTVWNSRMTEITGYTIEEINRHGWYQAVYPDPEVQGRAKDRMDRMRLGDNLKGEDWEITRSDGMKRAVSISTSVLQGTGGTVHVLGLFHDITDRKRAEEELRESEARFRQMVESSPLPIGIAAGDGTIEYLNPRFVATFGYDREDIPRLDDWFRQAFPAPGYRRDVFLRWRKTMEDRGGSGSGEGIEVEVTCKGGSMRVVELLPSVAGEKNLAIFRDITERKRSEEEKRRLEEQVQHSQRLESLGVLAGGIAHDFNNLLMAVLGHAELAFDHISPMSAARGNLAEITKASRRAAELCGQMLAYAGKSSFALERVGLRELVEEMAHLLRTAISKKAILNLNLERGLPPIEADPSQIRQIVMNLLINASEAIGDRSGVITVSVGATRCDEEHLQKTELHGDLAAGLYVHLEVADTGGGMDAKTRSRIFEPFFSTKFAGRGLGLAAVLGIVRAHKGALKVYSEPGKGTTFKILFPALAEGEDAVRSPEPSPQADWRGKGTILLVDDEESLLALGARMLEHLGFTVLTAADGRQAVDRYRERGKEIDLVLMDLTMPHMDGAEAFGELRRLNPDVRVILASGYGHEDVASRFSGKGLSGVLQKPYTLAKLRESLAGLLPHRTHGNHRP